jgi:hypothetical protein
MPRRFQFSLKTLFVGTMCFAAVCAGLSWLRGVYLIQVRTVESLLTEFPEIDRVWLSTNDDIMLEVEGLWFSTVDQPNVIFEAEGMLDGASKSKIRELLRQALFKRQPTPLPARATYCLR